MAFFLYKVARNFPIDFARALCKKLFSWPHTYTRSKWAPLAYLCDIKIKLDVIWDEEFSAIVCVVFTINSFMSKGSFAIIIHRHLQSDILFSFTWYVCSTVQEPLGGVVYPSGKGRGVLRAIVFVDSTENSCCLDTSSEKQIFGYI